MFYVKAKTASFVAKNLLVYRLEDFNVMTLNAVRYHNTLFCCF